MNKYLILFLVLASSANAELFYRANGATSVTLGDICVPEAAGVEIFALDFDTTNLTINISAQGDGIDNAIFTYTGVNIDDYDGTPPAWGNPAASSIEVEAQADGCVKLHVRDEVFAVTDATEWSIRFTDSTTDAIMDWHVQVLALGTSADIITAVTTALTNFGTATEPNVDAVEAKIDIIDTVVDAIQVITDQFTFTVAGEVDSNVESMNGSEVLGTGTSGDKWRGE